MIYLRLAGGLGNQLFQVAAASLYSHWLDQGVSIVDDGLSRYNSVRTLLYQYVLQPKKKNWEHVSTRSLMALASGRLRLGRLSVPVLSVADQNILKYGRTRNCRLPRFMDGYFQQFWTYELFVEALSHFYIYSPSEASASSTQNDCVAVHIRGSDFLLVKGFAVVDSSFYLRCFTQAVSAGYTNFDVYTDDLEYSQLILSPVRSCYPHLCIRVLPSGSVLEDFNGIRSAGARIIGNSTFSWWASALSNGGPTWSTPYFSEQCRKPFALHGEIYVA